MDNYTLFRLVTFWAIGVTGFLALIAYWNPYAIRLALAKRVVWICNADGELEPVKATLEGIAYKTKNHGLFEFERNDTVFYGKKPGIIVYGPYSKALRPEVMPVLSKLKKLGIDRYDVLMGILTSRLITEKDFEILKANQIQANQNQKQAEGSK